MNIRTPHFLKNYGLVCAKIGKISQGIDLLLQSIKLAPTDPGAYIEIIKLYLDQNRFTEAYSIAQHAKKNIPYSITLSMLYDQILMKIGKNFTFEKDN
jgi:predicted Zn-dependent protease